MDGQHSWRRVAALSATAERPAGATVRAVEAVVEGEPAVLEDFIRWCHRGPPQARVSGVQRTDGEATGEFSQFKVERTS